MLRALVLKAWLWLFPVWLLRLSCLWEQRGTGRALLLQPCPGVQGLPRGLGRSGVRIELRAGNPDRSQAWATRRSFGEWWFCWVTSSPRSPLLWAGMSFSASHPSDFLFPPPPRGALTERFVFPWQEWEVGSVWWKPGLEKSQASDEKQLQALGWL